MISLRPLTYRLGPRLGFRPADLAGAAVDRWQIAPPEIRAVPPAIILPGQAERVTRTEFTTLPLLHRSLAGDPAEAIGPTTAWRLVDVDVVDGVLYSRGLSLHLRARRHRLSLGRLADLGRGALYETWVGNRWFGNWLLDDCLTYPLAEAAGTPVATTPAATAKAAPAATRGGHVPRYEALLGMAPRRFRDAHFDELILFDDHANNSNRLARAQAMRARLTAHVSPGPDRGIFLLRGRSGDARVLENETAIADRLAASHGFRVLFAEDHDVDTLMSACAGARIIAGVEGSQLNHGIAAMAPGGTLLTLQPPDRATTAMKLLTDRWQQRFAMVVGLGGAESFHVPWDDLARTLDLIARETVENPS
jgi:hypothetical protein